MFRIKEILFSLLNKLIVFRSKIKEIKKIKEKRRVEIQKRVTLTKEQEKQVNEFYLKHYGKKILLNWHKNYYAISGKFDYKYFPEVLFIPYFERLSNNPNYYKCLQDKNITEFLVRKLDFVKSIKYYAKCSNGLLTDSNDNIISLNNLLEIVEGKKVFIKHTVDSSSGRDCRVCYIKNGIDEKTDEKFEDIIKLYGKNYIIQSLLKNNEDLSNLNPSSLNTFRVITYILDNKVYHMPIILRIGRNGSFLDNAHAGGIFIGVSDEGYLLPKACSEFGELYEMHPDTKIKFDGYYIKKMPEIIDVAHKLQTLFPHVGCVNWDLTLDENNDVVLIEANMRYGSIWLSQMAHGKGCFGDNTERVLELVKQNKKFY